MTPPGSPDRTGPDGLARTLPGAILAAAGRLRGRVRRTPLDPSPTFSDLVGSEVWLKCENLQHTGSFKVRGATNAVLSLTGEEGTGIVTASSGNHGAAVAHALRGTGRRGLVFVPTGASPMKVAAIQRLGAEVAFFGDDTADTEAHARAFARERGWLYVPPYSDPAVIAGQGTVAVEVVEDAGQPFDSVFVAVGGGGLIAGMAVHLKAVSPSTRVVGCSPAASCVMARSVQAGAVLDLPSGPTLSDGTAGGIEPDALTFPLCRDLVDEWIEVTEDEIAEAMRLTLDSHHMLVEGAAGVALAGAVKGGPALAGRHAAVVLCGANIARPTLKAIL